MADDTTSKATVTPAAGPAFIEPPEAVAAVSAPLAEGEEPYVSPAAAAAKVTLLRAEADLFFGTGTRALSKGSTFSKTLLDVHPLWAGLVVELDAEGRPVKEAKKK